MKGSLSLIATFSLLASTCSGHYIFQQLSIGSQKFAVYEHIRRNTNYNSPVTNLASKDLVCNAGGLTGTNTTTVDVKAGDSFTFTTDTAVYHQGPISVFMSRAPAAVHDYQGDGEWFKILDLGPTFSGSGATWPLRSTYTATIPKCIQDGEYLLRIQSLGIHNPYPAGTPQFYIGCAQIKVTGGGTTVPTPTVKIPGAFHSTDPGYTVNIYNNFKSYTVPGGDVWKGC